MTKLYSCQRTFSALLSKNDILKLAEQFDELEDREKILRIVYEEFRREYSSNIV